MAVVFLAFTDGAPKEKEKRTTFFPNKKKAPKILLSNHAAPRKV